MTDELTTVMPILFRDAAAGEAGMPHYPPARARCQAMVSQNRVKIRGHLGDNDYAGATPLLPRRKRPEFCWHDSLFEAR